MAANAAAEPTPSAEAANAATTRSRGESVVLFMRQNFAAEAVSHLCNRKVEPWNRFTGLTQRLLRKLWQKKVMLGL